ncbi:MAG TPA: class I SAM-dependent methyltransferase [Solirubrobacterales bacterium]|nr:class I SAM-dependent methyltransferase [Solirubrobacterales bacterium]
MAEISEQEPGATAGDGDGPTYWERRLRASDGLEGVGVTALGPGFNRWAYRARGSRFRAAAAPLLAAGPTGPVADIGSGSGFYLDQWQRLGAEPIIAADLTDVAVERLRDRFPGVEVARMDLSDAGALREAGLEPARFALVSAMDLLFHILDDEGYATAFENLAALLAPGGHLIFTEDMIRGSKPRRREIKVARPARRVARTWRRAGLERVSVEPLFALMNFPSAGGPRWRRWWSFLQRLLEPRPWLGGVVGALLYPVERLLVRRVRPGPSTKLIVLRKPADGS